MKGPTTVIAGTAASGDAVASVPPDDVLARVLADVVHTVPYSSASQFYEYFGDAPADQRYGVSCAWQSFAVGQRLSGLGAWPIRYHVDGRHVAAVVHSDEGLVVLDPYLLHLDPIRLNRAECDADGSVSASVPALPVRVDAAGVTHAGRVRAVWLQDRERLRLEYSRFSPTRGHYVVSRFFTLPTDTELRLVPPPADVIRPLLLHPEQNNVSIRVVDPVDNQLREVIYPLTTGEVTVRADGLISRDNQGAVRAAGSREFDRTLSALAAVLNVPGTDVCEFVLGAARIYRDVAPFDLTLPAYQAVDE